MRAGNPVALISDAGTPGISDPGAQLVAAAHAAGIPVVPIPGASATTTLLSAAGLPGGRFFFEGFLPTRPRQRDERLKTLAASGQPFLLFEAPHRIEALAKALQAVLSRKPWTSSPTSAWPSRPWQRRGALRKACGWVIRPAAICALRPYLR